jgi:hypothetical protein
LFVLQYNLITGNVEVNPGPELINHSSVSDNSISICNINIRSARNKLDFLNNFTDEFDIIAVTETYLHPNISNNDIEITMFILGFRLSSRESETTRNVHRKLVSSIS